MERKQICLVSTRAQRQSVAAELVHQIRTRCRPSRFPFPVPRSSSSPIIVKHPRCQEAGSNVPGLVCQSVGLSMCPSHPSILKIQTAPCFPRGYRHLS